MSLLRARTASMDDSEAAQLLKAERARVEEALAELETSARRDREDAVQDHGEPDDLVQAGHDAGQREQLEEDLRAVERAERRLAEGGYGVSVQSGEPIPDNRLRAQPTAERTVAEQERFGG